MILVRPHNLGALFALMAILGICSITMLPVALELAAELTRNSNASSAILWATYVRFMSVVRCPDWTGIDSSNLFTIGLVLGNCSQTRCTGLWFNTLF